MWLGGGQRRGGNRQGVQSPALHSVGGRAGVWRSDSVRSLGEVARTSALDLLPSRPAAQVRVGRRRAPRAPACLPASRPGAGPRRGHSANPGGGRGARGRATRRPSSPQLGGGAGSGSWTALWGGVGLKLDEASGYRLTAAGAPALERT